MIDNKKITAVILILVFIFTATAAVGAQGRINDMNFKNADLTDVLRAIAEVADVNLITDSNVSGTITIHLKEISFDKALDLITQTRSLTYKWDGNTVVVASPDRIDEIYSNIVTKFVAVKSNDLDNISVIVKDIFPETQITADPVRRQFVLKGEEKRVVEIKEMIERLDLAAVAQQQDPGAFIASEDGQTETGTKIYTESYKVVNTDLADLTSKLQGVNSNLSIRSNELTNTVTISGREAEVKEAVSMAKTYDNSLEPATRSIRVDYVDTEQISEIIGKFYPDVKLHVNTKRKEIIINGSRNKLDGVEELVKEINKPQYQVVIETRVEEISSNFRRQLGIEHNGEFDIIRGSENYKIEELDFTWPEFFKALDTSTDTKTLARPSLMTLNGEEATLSILEEEPYPVVDTDSDTGDKTTTWEYVEAGVELTFTPWITENDEIELQIAPTVSSFSETVFGTEGAYGETPPPAKKSRSVETTLRLKNNETFAVGGLIQTNSDGKITKIPLLGDIPLFGELFKYRNKSNDTNELIIFVTPHIIKYGDEISDKNIIKSENEKISNIVKEKIKLETKNSNNIDTEAEKSKEEIIQEYLEKRSKSREEALDSLKNNKKQENKEFQELTPEELEALISNNN
jgi:general secretion pathway protein D